MDRESGCCRRVTSGWVLVKFLVWKRAILRKVKEINGLLTSYCLFRDPKNRLRGGVLTVRRTRVRILDRVSGLRRHANPADCSPATACFAIQRTD